MTEDHVHLIVCRWMRKVMGDKGWNANHWACLAGIEATTITRTMNGERRIMPSFMTIARLAAVAGSQPDLLKGGRRTSTYVMAPSRRQVAARA
jgi:transcriptional regulator with XRE-family HTH domain